MPRVVDLVDLPQEDPGLSVTSSALQHIRRSIQKTPDPKLPTPMGLRVGVKKAGCSGYEYTLALAYPTQQSNLDFTFHFDEIAILVDKEIYLKFLKGGTIMDFRKEGMNEGLAFDNPNVAEQCGCGESFTLK